MTKYAPIYMSVYDGTDFSLVDLALSADTFVVGTAAGTVIGTLTNMQAEDSQLSIVETDGYAALDGDDLVVGPTASAEGTFDVTVRETNIYGDNSPHDTTFTITVTAA